MDQPPLVENQGDSKQEPEDHPLDFLPAEIPGPIEGNAFVSIVRSREQLEAGLANSSPELQWLQVEDLLDDEESWRIAARGSSDVPLDVIIDDPATQFSQIYQLTDVFAAREVRVSIPIKPGFLKALRIAVSLRLSVRLLPGQPDLESVKELEQALQFYLHDPMVETRIEPFHSVLAGLTGEESGSLWRILEQDPAVFLHRNSAGDPVLPFNDQIAIHEQVETQFSKLIESGAECATCPWSEGCRGYFKHPAPDYGCQGVKRIFGVLEVAAAEIQEDLSRFQAKPELAAES